ncbi:MAG: glycosyltransferase family 2 protein [Burkholderiales bacterium]|nr:glycosyltransferase family 2 protein [Anaerolineae bacterium]
MPDALALSAIILSYNDEQLLRAALESVTGWISEIFVVDSGSTDRTREIAREFTDNIVVHPFENYAAQRNWAQDNLPLHHEWILHLDADERVTPELRHSLELFFASSQPHTVNGLLIARRTVFMGRWIKHGGHYPVYHLRVFRRVKGRCEDRLYDQHFTVSGPTLLLQGDIIDTITTSLDNWMLRHIRWASLEVQEQQQEQPQTVSVSESRSGTPIEQRRWYKNSVYNRLPLFTRAFAYFFYRYILRFGFLDGPQGLIFHILQGFWFRFYIDAKLWEERSKIHRLP